MLDISIMAYVNIHNKYNAADFYLAIPCACVGVILFWCYVIRGDELGSGFGTDYLAGEDLAERKNRKLAGSSNCFKMVFGRLNGRNDTSKMETNQNPIIKKSVKYRNDETSIETNR